MSKVQIQWQVNWSCFVNCRPLLVIHVNPPLFPAPIIHSTIFSCFLPLGFSVSSCTQLLTKQQLVAAKCNAPSNEIRFESPTALRIKITVSPGYDAVYFRCYVCTKLSECLPSPVFRAIECKGGGGGRGRSARSSDILYLPTKVQAWQPRSITAKLIYAWYYYYYYYNCCDVVLLAYSISLRCASVCFALAHYVSVCYVSGYVSVYSLRVCYLSALCEWVC